MDKYEIINGKKYKKCKDNQIRNLKTMRCNKECPPKQIKNPKTNRCVSINGKIGKQLLTIIPSSPKKIDKNKAAMLIQRKMKRFLYPFINRVTAHIYDRIVYYKNLIRNVKLNPKRGNYCVKFYKMNKDKKPIFRIGNNIILKKRIGSSSSHGLVYLSTFRDKNKRLFKYAVKIIPITYKSLIEVKIITALNEAVIKNKCPHFPISYGNAKCLMNNKENSSFSGTNEKPETSIQLPLKADNYLVYLTELANGDLETFLKDVKDQSFTDNAITQIYLSLLFYYKEISSYHCDAHSGNFLYHKIKPGGYFYYKIGGVDYYLKNEGYLWVIWDFEQSVPLTSKLSNHNVPLTMGYDFRTITGYFLNENYRKYLNSSSINKTVYSRSDYNKFFNFIITILVSKIGALVSNISPKDIIINKHPFVL